MEEPKTRNRNDIAGSGLQVAANLARLRKLRGLSTAELSRRLGEVGRPIVASGITKIEKGMRQVTVDDLIALAVVLEVDVPALLLPPDVAEQVEITGAGSVPGFLARAWMEGVSPLVHPSDDPDGRKLLDHRLNVRPRGWDPERNVGLKLRQRLSSALDLEGGE